MLYNPHASTCTTLLSVRLGKAHQLPVSSRTICAVRTVHQQRNPTSRMKNHQRECDWWPKINTIQTDLVFFSSGGFIDKLQNVIVFSGAVIQ